MPASPSADSAAPSLSEKEKSSPEPTDAVSVKSEEEDDLDPAKLQKAFRFAAWSSIILVRLFPALHLRHVYANFFDSQQLAILLLLVPLPLFFAQTVFGKRGLEAWVVIGMISAFCSAFTVILYPLWESRRELGGIGRGIILVSPAPSKGDETTIRLADGGNHRTSSQRAVGGLRRGPRRRRDH